jgi:hypothetical protein
MDLITINISLNSQRLSVSSLWTEKEFDHNNVVKAGEPMSVEPVLVGTPPLIGDDRESVHIVGKALGAERWGRETRANEGIRICTDRLAIV